MEICIVYISCFVYSSANLFRQCLKIFKKSRFYPLCPNKDDLLLEVFCWMAAQSIFSFDAHAIILTCAYSYDAC